jgi:hypothetical protein
MQYIWSAVLLMNSDLLDVTFSQLYTFTNVSKEPTAPSSTGSRAKVLPEAASVTTSKMALSLSQTA